MNHVEVSDFSPHLNEGLGLCLFSWNEKNNCMYWHFNKVQGTACTDIPCVWCCNRLSSCDVFVWFDKIIRDSNKTMAMTNKCITWTIMCLLCVRCMWASGTQSHHKCITVCVTLLGQQPSNQIKCQGQQPRSHTCHTDLLALWQMHRSQQQTNASQMNHSLCDGFIHCWQNEGQQQSNQMCHTDCDAFAWCQVHGSQWQTNAPWMCHVLCDAFVRPGTTTKYQGQQCMESDSCNPVLYMCLWRHEH